MLIIGTEVAGELVLATTLITGTVPHKAYTGLLIGIE